MRWADSVSRRRVPVGLSLAIVLATTLVVGLPLLGAWLADAGGRLGIELGIGPARVGAVVTTKTNLVIHSAKHAVITSTTVGVPIHAFVTVTSTGLVTGDVVVRIYASGNCSDAPVLTSNPTPLLNGAVDVTSLPVEGGSVTNISFRASYEGNATFGRSTSTCVSVAVNKATPTVAVEWHDSSHAVVTELLVTRNAHVRVQVTGSGSTPSGQVTLALHTQPDCSDTVASPEVLTLSGGVAESSAKMFRSATNRYAKVSYPGSSIYNPRTSTCKPIAWVRADPSLTFALHKSPHTTVSGSHPTNVPIHPAVTAGGSLGTPGGTYAVRRYAGTSCAGATFTQTAITLTDGAVDASLKPLPLVSTPQTFSYAVSYSGNTLYNAALSTCRTIVFKATPAVFVEAHTLPGHVVVVSVPQGTSFHDAVTVTGDFGTPTGSVTIEFFLNATCSGSRSGSSVVAPLVGGQVDASKAVKPGPGDYAFLATYSGDGTYTKATGCGSVTVLEAGATPPPATPTPIPPTPTPAAPTTGPGPTTATGNQPTSPPGAVPTAAASLPPGETPAASLPSGATSIPGATPTPFVFGPGGSGAPAPVATSGPDTANASGKIEIGTVLIIVLVALAVISAGGLLYMERNRKAGGSS